jgi:hypothetical protein
MSILILSTVRSGSSQLLEAVGKYYNKQVVFEPTTPMYKKPFNPEEDIVKIVLQTLTTVELLELINKFDKTILLDRKDIIAQSESYLNLWNNLDGKYNVSYVNIGFTDYEIQETIKKFTLWKKKLDTISTKTSIPIVYLEDLIEGKEIGIGYDKAFFEPSHKLRKKRPSLF